MGTPERSLTCRKVWSLQGGESLVGRRVHEREREPAASQAGSQRFQADAGALQRPGHLRAAHVAGGQPAIGVGHDDAQLDEPVHVLRLDSGLTGCLRACQLSHVREDSRPA